MNVTVEIASRRYRLGRCVDLALPLDFAGPQANAYGVPAASATPFSGEGFTLNTQAGGPCNCMVLTITPHCNGTHTESAGHITRERFPIANVMPEPFLPATVITVTPRGREIVAEEIASWGVDSDFREALVVRTMPNEAGKRTRKWEDAATPFYTPEAIAEIRKLGVKHLLVDVPSLDPLVDGGKLAAHRTWWGLRPGSQELPAAEVKWQTVTELIYVPDDVPDGRYLLSLQLPRFVSDAAPSRPLLFFLEETQ